MVLDCTYIYSHLPLGPSEFPLETQVTCDTGISLTIHILCKMEIHIYNDTM